VQEAATGDDADSASDKTVMQKKRQIVDVQTSMRYLHSRGRLAAVVIRTGMEDYVILTHAVSEHSDHCHVCVFESEVCGSLLM